MHRITCIETVERTYEVEDAGGDTAEQSARDRLHLWFRDPETVAPGIVKQLDGEKRTGRRIKDAKKVAKREEGPTPT